MDISGIVLAGGKGMRLGQNKAVESIGDKSLLQQVISSLGFLNSDIIIVTADKQSFSQMTECPRVRTVTDIYPDRGPLGGIYTGLATSGSFYNLVVACDMPFLNQALLRYLTEVVSSFDVVIPRLDNKVEPLHAVYSKGCLSPLEDLLRQGNLQASQLLNLVRVRYVDQADIDRFDPHHLSFFNINTKADLKTARELARGN